MQIFYYIQSLSHIRINTARNQRKTELNRIRKKTRYSSADSLKNKILHYILYSDNIPNTTVYPSSRDSLFTLLSHFSHKFVVFTEETPLTLKTSWQNHDKHTNYCFYKRKSEKKTIRVLVAVLCYALCLLSVVQCRYIVQHTIAGADRSKGTFGNQVHQLTGTLLVGFTLRSPSPCRCVVFLVEARFLCACVCVRTEMRYSNLYGLLYTAAAPSRRRGAPMLTVCVPTVHV